jgi:hypothetical protein
MFGGLERSDKKMKPAKTNGPSGNWTARFFKGE